MTEQPDQPTTELPKAAPAPDSAAPPKRVRRRLDPLALVVLVVAVGIVIAAVHHPQAGMYVASAGLAAAAVLRLVLRERDAGSLVVRPRQIDVVLLAGLAVALGVLAAVTPFPHGSG
jgi:hypothetical protein